MRKLTNPQFQESKKAGRRKRQIFRDMKYCTLKEKEEIMYAPSSSLEEVAKAMGMILK